MCRAKQLYNLAYLDLDSLLESYVQRLVMLLQLVLWMQWVVSTFTHSNINTGRQGGNLAGISVWRSSKGTVHYQINRILQLTIILQQQAPSEPGHVCQHFCVDVTFVAGQLQAHLQTELVQVTESNQKL